MKRLVSVFLCLVMLFSLFSMVTVANAEYEDIGIKLPDGGQSWQPAGDAVHGYTSGGLLGKVEMACYITATHGSASTGNDYVTNTMLSTTRSTAEIAMSITVFYVEENGGLAEAENYKTYTYVPDSGSIITVYAPNRYMYKGTAGSRFTNTDYGSWIAGTIIETES